MISFSLTVQLFNLYAGASNRGVLYIKVFLKISQNSQENTCVRISLLMNLQAWSQSPPTLFKKRLWHRCFPVNFGKFLRTCFLQNTFGRLSLCMPSLLPGRLGIFTSSHRYFMEISEYWALSQILSLFGINPLVPNAPYEWYHT